MKSKILKNFASLSIVQVANYVFPLLTVPIISRIIGPEKFGIINYSSSICSYFILMIGYGFDLTATRLISQAPNDVKLRNSVFCEVFYAQILLFLISIVIFLVCLNFIPLLYQDKKVAIFSFIACIGTVLTQNWLFQAMQDLPKIAILNFVTKLIFTFSILLVIRKESDYVYQPLVSSLVVILVSLVSFLWAYKKYNLTFIKIDSMSVLILLWREKVVFFSVVVISLYTTTNTVLLGFMQNAREVGYYTAGQRLISVIFSAVSMPLSMALFPYIGAAFGKSREAGIDLVKKMLPIIFIGTFILGFFLLLIGPWLLPLFFGSKFAPSIPAFKILVFIPLIISLSNLFGIQIMMHLKMDKLFFRIVSACAVLSIFMNILLIHKYANIGAALNWLFTELIITVSMFIGLYLKGIRPVDLNQFKLYNLTNNVKSIFKK